MYTINIGDYNMYDYIDDNPIIVQTYRGRCLSASIGGIGVETDTIPWENTEYNPWDYRAEYEMAGDEKHYTGVFTLDPIPVEEPEYIPICWNNEILAGTVTPNVTLPTPAGNKAESITYMFKAASATASFTAPSGWILCKDDGTAGLSTGNTLSFTDLTVGSIYEVSFKPISSSVIRLLMCETKTA